MISVLLWVRKLFALLIFWGALYTLLFGFAMKDFISLIKLGEVITYNKTLILIGAIPVILYLCITLSWALISSKTSPFRKIGNIHTIIIASCIFIFILGFALSFITQVLLLIYYEPCPQERLADFYVINLKLCETLTPRGFW